MSILRSLTFLTINSIETIKHRWEKCFKLKSVFTTRLKVLKKKTEEFAKFFKFKKKAMIRKWAARDLKIV